MSGLRPSTPNNSDGGSDDPTTRSPNNNNNNSAPFLSNQPSSANSASAQGGGGGGLLSTSPSHRASIIGGGSNSNGHHLGHPTLQYPNQSSTRTSNASHQRPSTRGSAAVKGKFVLLRNNATGGSGITSPVGSTRNIHHGGGGGRAGGGSDLSSRRGGGALPLPPNPSRPHFGRANSIQREEDYAAANSRPTSGSEEDDDEEEEEDDEEEEEFDRNAFKQVASEINVNVNALIKKLQAAESGGHKETMLRAKLRQNTRGGEGATEARVVDVAYLASPSSSRPYGSNTPSPVGSGKFTGATAGGGSPIDVEAAFAAAAGGGSNYRNYGIDGDGDGQDDIYSGDGRDFEEEDEEEYDEEDGYYFGDDDDEEDQDSGESDDVSQDNLNAHNNNNNNNINTNNHGASGDFYSAHGRGGHLYNLRGDAVVDANGSHQHQQPGSGNLTPTGNSPSAAANGGGSISGKFRAALPTSVGGAPKNGASRHGSVVSDTNTEMGPPSHSTIGGEQSQSLLASNDDGNGSATGGGGGRKRRAKTVKAPPVKKGITFSKNEVSDVVVYEVGNELFVGVSFKRSWIGWAAAAAALLCDTAFDVHMIYVLYHIDNNITAIQNWVAINRLFVSAITVILAFVLKIGMRPLRWVLSTVGFVALCLMSMCLGLGAAFEVITIEVTGQAHFYVASVLYCVWLIGYRIIRKEMIFFVEVAATLVAVGGFMLSGFSTDISLSAFDAALGNVLVLVASLCYASYFVLIDRLRRRAPVVPMAAIQGVFAVIVGIPLALGFGNSGREAFGLFFSSAGFMHSLFISMEGLAGNLLMLASVKYLDVLTIAAIYTLKSTIVPILSKLIVFNHLVDPPAFTHIEPSWNVILGTLLAFVGTATVVIFASMRRSFVSRRISTSKRKKVPNPYNRRARKEEKKRLKRLAEEKAAAEAAIAAGAIIPASIISGGTE